MPQARRRRSLLHIICKNDGPHLLCHCRTTLRDRNPLMCGLKRPRLFVVAMRQLPDAVSSISPIAPSMNPGEERDAQASRKQSCLMEQIG